MDRLFRVILWPCIIALLASAEITMAQVYVATSGNDHNDGSKQAPLATLAKAVAVAHDKALKQILIAGGKYYDVGVELTAADNGLTIAGAPGQDTILIGGVPLTGWTPDGPFMAAPLPPARNWDVRMLQVDGQMCPRARFPEKGILQCLNKFDVRWMSSTGGGWQRKPTSEELSTLKYKDSDLPPNLDIGNVEITVYHSWDESCVGVTANDQDNHVLTLSPPTTYPPGAFHHHEYILWNIREGLTQPGQWYLDRAGARIVYRPREGQDMSKAIAVVPTQHSIIRIRGTKDAPAKDIVLQNLQLQVTTVPLTAAGFAADKYPGAVDLAYAQNVRIDALTVQQVAGQAINTSMQPAEACSDITVENSTVSECGAGGIYIGGARAIIRNNLVHGVGRMYPSAVGIHREGKDCLISHNEVFDTTYSAIDYRGQNIIIENNLLSDCMKTLHDGAAIYMFASNNCIMRNNVVRDIRDTGNPVAGASAYYLDERCQDCTVEGNLALNIAWPIQNHMAKNNTIRNNVIVTKGDLRLTMVKSTGYNLEGNVWYATGKIHIEMGDGYTWKNNILFTGSHQVETILMNGYNPKSTSYDPPGDTTMDDPGFVDLAGGDYHFRPDGAAGKLGLKGVDIQMAGRQSKATPK